MTMLKLPVLAITLNNALNSQPLMHGLLAFLRERERKRECERERERERETEREEEGGMEEGKMR